LKKKNKEKWRKWKYLKDMVEKGKENRE